MRKRIAGYDFARSLALFGLVSGTFTGDVEHIELTWIYDSIRQGAITTFLVLGGIGISLLKQRDQRTNDAYRSANSRKRLIKRTAALLVVGICCNLIWQIHFLGFYSICIAIGALLLTATNRWLWSFAFIFVLIWAAFVFWIFNDHDVIENFEILQDSDPWTTEGMVFRVFLYRFHLIFFLTAFLLVGMCLGQQKVQPPKVRKAVFFGGIAGVLVSVFIPWLLKWLSIRPLSGDLTIETVWLLLFWLFYLFAECGTITAIIAGSLILTEKYPDAKWTKPFIATGQLALTLYVVHLVVDRGMLNTLGGLDKTFLFAIGSTVIFCICAVIFSHYWTKRFERGPLEWGIRRITG